MPDEIHNSEQQYYSASAQEIISSRPGYWERHGTVIIFFVLGLALSLTWFIKYPETVNTQATLTGTNTPKPIVSHVSGRIIKLFKSNNDTVAAGDIIACMETIADWQEVLRLSGNMDTICEQIENGNYNAIAVLMQENFTNLGELQRENQTFRQAYISFQSLALSGYAQKKRSLLEKDNALIDRAQGTIQAQNKLQQRDLRINQSNLEKNKILLDNGVISQAEYDRLISENISKQIVIPQTQSSIINAETQKNKTNKEILDIDNQAVMQTALFSEAAFNFKNAIDDWKNRFLIIASISGTLSFTAFIQENQQLQAGTPIAYINPSNSTYYLQTTIPQQNFGKVANGQKVLLKFPAYQWQEYGSVLGKVAYVSPNASDSGYIATITLPAGLVTNYNKHIVFHDGLKANAEIITKDMRLAQRFYYSVVKQVNK